LFDKFGEERMGWIEYLERNVDKIAKGGVYFIGKSLWGPERITEINITYSINLIFKYFNSLINPYSRLGVLNEVLTATKMFIVNKDMPKYFEWQTILDMLELCYIHVDRMLEKKNRVELDIIADIFELMKVPLTFNEFPDYLMSQVYSLFLKYKNKKAYFDLHFTQMMIDYMLKFEF
jgi:hypothetical protein